MQQFRAKSCRELLGCSGVDGRLQAMRSLAQAWDAGRCHLGTYGLEKSEYVLKSTIAMADPGKRASKHDRSLPWKVQYERTCHSMSCSKEYLQRELREH